MPLSSLQSEILRLLATHRDLAAKLTELERKLAGHDHAIRELFATIRQMLKPPGRPPREVGFHPLLKTQRRQVNRR